MLKLFALVFRMYLNQASLQRIHFEVYCSNEGVLKHHIGRSFHWSRNYWLQGPRLTKTENIHVEPKIFIPLLNSSVRMASTSTLRESLVISAQLSNILPMCSTDKFRSRLDPFPVENQNTSFMMRTFISSITLKGRTKDGYWDLSIMGQVQNNTSAISFFYRVLS